MARVARICATRVARGTSPSGRQLCPARGVSRGIASYVNPSPAPGRHFGIRRGPGRRQRIPLMMLNHRRPIQTSMSCAAPEGAWREAAARFPQAYAMGLKGPVAPRGLTRGPIEARDLPRWLASCEDLVGHGRGTRPATIARVARRPTAGLVPRPCPTPACAAPSVRRA